VLFDRVENRLHDVRIEVVEIPLDRGDRRAVRGPRRRLDRLAVSLPERFGFGKRSFDDASEFRKCSLGGGDGVLVAGRRFAFDRRTVGLPESSGRFDDRP
jgi:hypothetical protein